MKKIRACSIIVHEEKVLLLWRNINDKEYFVFPGGGKEEGETLEEATVREALEETSISVNVDKLLYRLIDENNEHNFYLCSYVSGEPKLGNANELEISSDSNQYKPMWVDIRELPSTSLLPLEIRDRFIEDYQNNFINTPREETINFEDRRRL